MDPLELWKRWLEAYTAGAAAFAQGLGNLGEDQERYADPFGLFREWMKLATPSPDRTQAETRPPFPPFPPDPLALWRQWLELLAGSGRKAPSATTEKSADPSAFVSEWLKLLEPARAGATDWGAPSFSLDPLTFFLRWYAANSATWTKAANELIGSEAFAEASSRLLDAYISFSRALRQTAERQLTYAQLPARADIARVAGLIVALEEKVDRIEEALAGAQESAANHTTPAADDVVARLVERLGQVERKLDQLSAAVERLAVERLAVERLAAERPRPEQASAANGAPRSTRQTSARPDGARGGRRRAPGNGTPTTA
jgi:polyhydroxyalkanoic acid synthase PhaR subunit